MWVELTPDEIIYNGGGLAGVEMRNPETLEAEVISYVKPTNKSRQLLVVTEDEDTFLINQNQRYWFKTNKELKWAKPNKRKRIGRH